MESHPWGAGCVWLLSWLFPPLSSLNLPYVVAYRPGTWKIRTALGIAWKCTILEPCYPLNWENVCQSAQYKGRLSAEITVWAFCLLRLSF
jgi:hypothetical protein